MPNSSSPHPNPAHYQCPLPDGQPREIQLGHGGGGRLTQQLIDYVFAPAFSNPALAAEHDGAQVITEGGRLAFATDAHVVSPLFFPGGDIGSLSVHGTANDLAMCGARPRWLSVAFILEEGLPIADLQRVVASMRAAAAEIDLPIVTGDTKVVERGRADGLYVTTSGVGRVVFPQFPAPSEVRAGDIIVLSGDIGRHGMAIMAQREGLAFESPITSDTAHLWPVVEAFADAELHPHCLRDLTRGGLATALIEIARKSRHRLAIDEAAIAVSEPVRGACEILGLDPLYVANEGRMVAFFPPEEAEKALAILGRVQPGGGAAIIGRVGAETDGQVHLRSTVGVERILDRLSGEQLPRIC